MAVQDGVEHFSDLGVAVHGHHQERVGKAVHHASDRPSNSFLRCAPVLSPMGGEQENPSLIVLIPLAAGFLRDGEDRVYPRISGNEDGAAFSALRSQVIGRPAGWRKMVSCHERYGPTIELFRKR